MSEIAATAAPTSDGERKIEEFLSAGPVVPVVVIDDPDHAVALAQALLRGNVRVIEITLRTPAGLQSIERIAREVPEIHVGAGTVTSPGDVEAAAAAGAEFLVLPASPEKLLAAALASSVPVLPAATSPTEMMRLMEHGLNVAKFFPASASGGTAFLSAIAGPLPQARWCPTGGISQTTAPDYLALPNVVCVGASWVAPRAKIAARDWDAITALAGAASSLRS